jgi:3-keto-disaccharide hydrolase
MRPLPTSPIHLLATCLVAALCCARSVPGEAGSAVSAMSRAGPLNTLTAAERAAGWRLLFDGKTTAGWRGWKMDSMPSGWRAVDGALARTSQAADIITTEKFKNFELWLEWNIAPGGNSGILYRASEDDEAIYWTAPEMQVLDDAGHGDGQSRLTAAGANYGLDPAPAGVVKPAGQWNQVRILVQGNHVEHWLNGVKVVEYGLGSPDWEAKVKASKFAPHARYGRNAEGYIGLQEHGAWVAFRNIKIKTLP